jgi:hypothetical protein
MTPVFQWIHALKSPPRVSGWYRNATGDLAVRAQVVCGEDGVVRARLTLRRGGYRDAYCYSTVQTVLPCRTGEHRKAFRLACRQAEHLATLRYRFTR